MIGVIFDFQGSPVEVRIQNNSCLFRSKDSYGGFVPIEGLRLSKNGVIKEFPDLKEKENWRQLAIDRFKEKIRTMKTEDEQMNYIIEDLTKYGYIPLYKQKEGFRPTRL